MTILESLENLIEYVHLVLLWTNFQDYFYQTIKICMNKKWNKWWFIELLVLIKLKYFTFFRSASQLWKNLYFHILFNLVQVCFCSKTMKTFQTITFIIIFGFIPLNNADSFFTTREWHPFPLVIIKRIICFSRFELCFET